MPLNNINHIILILSGKGGVGKSSITTQLALTLTLRGHRVGVLDLDLTGPNIPRFFGVEDGKVVQSAAGLEAVSIVPDQVESQLESQNGSASSKLGSLAVMSLGFVLPSRSSAVIWRGPKKTAMVRQFLTQTAWPGTTSSRPLDYLLIDTPPGTSDEHISLLESLHMEFSAEPEEWEKKVGAVVVTTPQAISVSDVKKELGFCQKTATKVLGVVENMAGFVCPHCAECTNIFSRGGGEVMATEYGVPFLGRVPIDPSFGTLIEEGRRPEYPEGTKVEGGRELHVRDGERLVDKYTSCVLYGVFESIVERLESNG
jgi:Mrp family chromosome partitioning ATPase